MIFSRFFGNLKRVKQGLNAQKLFVGLGNPGEEYADTRHNAGFMAIDSLQCHLEEQTHSHFINSESINGVLDHKSVLLAKPMTYMNRSGYAVKELLEKFNLPLSECLIIVVDFNIPLGSFRFRKDGSHGGHNGLKSIISMVGPQFPRLRVGIGPLPSGVSVIDFVLGKFDSSQKERICRVTEEVSGAVSFMLKNGIDGAMNRYNSLFIE